MAIHALTVGETFPYVLNADPAKKKVPLLVDPNDPKKGEIITDEIGEDATVWNLGTLDVFLLGYIYDSASTLQGQQGSDEIGIKTHVNKTNIEAVRFGLKSVENWNTAKGVGQSVDFVEKVVNGRKYQALTDDTLMKIGLRAIAELAGEIKKASEVAAEEEKNFG